MSGDAAKKKPGGQSVEEFTRQMLNPEWDLGLYTEEEKERWISFNGQYRKRAAPK